MPLQISEDLRNCQAPQEDSISAVLFIMQHLPQRALQNNDVFEIMLSQKLNLWYNKSLIAEMI